MWIVRYLHKYSKIDDKRQDIPKSLDKIHDGIIYNKGQRFSASCKRRYFILRSDGNLYCCKIEDKLEPQKHRKMIQRE